MKHRQRSSEYGPGNRADRERRRLRFEALEPRLVLDSTVVFNEIMYHPATAPLAEGDYEWVELFNQMAINMDVSGWSLQGAINYTFPKGTVIPGRSYKVIASNPSALATAGIFSGALGPYGDRLGNDGETLQLLNNSGRLMNEVAYGDNGDWPVGPDGSGFSLAKLDAYAGSSDAASWVISRQANGTPGVVNFSSGADAGPGIVFNEIPPAVGSGFWVEITNQGTSNYQLGGATIVTSAAAGNTYTFPTQSLAPGQCLQVTQAQLGFGAAESDKLYFYSANKDRLLDARAVDTRLRGLAAGRGNAWLYPNAATAGAANSFSFHDEIVVNEVMYHALPTSPATTTSSLLAIDAATQWRYTQTGTNLGVGWAQASHAVNNITWYSGPGLLAYTPLSLPVRTTLNNPLTANPYVITTYFETDFDFSENASEVSQLLLGHMIDDGAIFYLNGVEVLRYNMPTGTVVFNTVASSRIDASYHGSIPISKDNLRQGTNRLSVEVHQVATDSTDIVFGADLSVATTTPGQESDEEWIELYNRGTSPVNLTGWSLSKAVDYDFPTGTVIPAGGYLVVANHAAEMQAKYPAIAVVGDFDKSLSNTGDGIVLLAPDRNPADVVHYYDEGYWSDLADGGGSSLELRNPNADNSKPEAWAASNERGQGVWETYTLTTLATADTGPMSDSPPASSTWNEFLLGMLDSGEVLIDDVSVIRNPGTGSAFQMIQNGSFQSDTLNSTPLKWRIIGNHHGTVVADPDNASNKVLDLRATGVTTHEGNNAGTTFVGNTAIVNGTVYEISFKARWLSGSPQLNARFYLNRVGQTFVLKTPANTGTPGAPNSAYTANLGPTYSELKHTPVAPVAGQSATVTVKAEDPNTVSSMKLFWLPDGGSWSNTTMTLAGGVYSAAIPGQVAGKVVQFYVQGQDSLGAISTFPAAGANSRALYQVNDGQGPTTAIDAIRIILRAADNATLFDAANLMSNEGLSATVIYNNKEVFYDVGVQLKGSSYSRGDAYWGGSYTIDFHPDHLFRGVHSQISVDSSGRGSGGTIDTQSQAQILVDQILNHGGGSLASNYEDLAYVIVPQTGHSGTVSVQMARYEDVFLEENYLNGADGNLFEFEIVYYHTGTTNGNPESPKILTGGNYTNTPPGDLGSDKERYRWNWLIKNHRSEDDFTQIIAMNKAFSLTGSAFLAAIAPLIDADEWLRTFAAANLMGISDTFANGGNTHNIVFYVRPDDGKILMLPWDWDEAFRVSATSNIAISSQLNKLLASPAYAHAYYGHLYDLISTTFNTTYMSSWSSHFGSLVPPQDFSPNITYIASRRASVLSQLNSAVPPVSFAITTNGGNNFTVSTPTATLAGSGWINVREIRLASNSQPLPMAWSTTSGWQVTVPLATGANPLTLNAYDFQGNLVASDTITITSTAAVPQPRDWLRVSEIMYHPSAPPPGTPGTDAEEFEYLELQNTGMSPLDLTGVKFTAGITFTFPALTLQPGAFTVIVENATAFASRYPGVTNIAGQYTDKLSNSGETLTLLDAAGFTIQSFAFLDDDWYPTTDGPGYALVIVDSAGPLSVWGTQAGWRPSSYAQGSPGVVDPLPGVLVTPTAGLTTTESGDTAQFSVTLKSQPLASVTIVVASSNSAEGTPSATSLTFTPENWSQPQTVTVTGVSDWLSDGDAAYTILLLPAASGDPVYNNLDPADVSLVNIDKTRLWDGGGGNALWTTPLNWQGDVAPLPGDLLLFPEDAAQKTATNNFAAGTVFQSLVFRGNGYLLQGNAVQLVAGIFDISTAGTQDNRVALGSITLTLPQTLQNLHLDGSLVVQSPLLLGDNRLTIEAVGGIRLEGILSGAAGIAKTGSGLLTLTALNTYGGDTMVVAGQLDAQQIGSNSQPAAKIEVQGNSQLIAVSIIADSLTIGSLPINAVNTVATNAAAPLVSGESQSVANDIPASTVIGNATISSTSIASPAFVAQPRIDRVNATTSLATPAASMLAAASRIAPSALSVFSQNLSIPEIASTSTLPEQMEQQNIEPLYAHPLLKESFAWALTFNRYMSTRFDRQSAHAFSSPSLLIDRLKDSVYEELTETWAKAKMLPPQVLTGIQSVRSLALQSLAIEHQQYFAIKPVKSELLVSKQFRKHEL